MWKKLLILILLTSCTLYDPLTINFNYDDSEVILQTANFVVIDHVTDTLNTFKVFHLTPRQERYLISKSLESLNAKADMVGKPRALISVNTTVKRSFSPIFRKYQVITSGDVIEFRYP